MTDSFAEVPDPVPTEPGPGTVQAVQQWWAKLSKRAQVAIGVGVVAVIAFMAVASTGAFVEDPECLEVSPGVAELIDDADLTAAVLGPSDFRGRHQWYYASPTGGLWIFGRDPEDGSGSSFIAPLNGQARSESVYGSDVRVGSPAYEGTDQNGREAKAALDCARR